MAKYDLRVSMNLVANKTNDSKAIYIGFSMGTSIVNVYSILYPEEADNRLAGIIEMAPVANLSNTKSVVEILAPAWPSLEIVGNLTRHGNLLPTKRRKSEFCSSNLFGMLICYSETGLVFGIDYSMLDPVSIEKSKFSIDYYSNPYNLYWNSMPR
ncbi:hypothetical protein JTB14_037746 [Gonioctena quinquepunctata]|nr:hypothetical protein JTB14_037746 [Gonioctena quinquepunctata]